MRSLLVTILALTAISTSVLAQAPDSLSFQGFLTDSLGNPIDSTGVSITFTLYKNGVGVWTEMQTVDVEDGVFNVLLGKVTDLSTLAFDQPMDLGIKLDGEASEISPRTPLAAAAYAKALPGLYTFYRVTANRKSYNVVGGAANNFVGAGVTGATISGGGGIVFATPVANSVLGTFGTVGGGLSNTASGTQSTVGGGERNTASGNSATVGGGALNTASGFRATVGGGSDNTASGPRATVPGGRGNRAEGSYSFAAGRKAKAAHDNTFVWNDNSGGDTLSSTADDQFLIRARGGVGIGTNAPMSQLEVNDGYVTVTNKGSGAILLHLNTDRGWVFRQHGTGADTKLELAGIGAGANKSFIITTLGNVGIGTTSPSQKLHVNGSVLANNVSVPSDRRLKRNILPISNSLHTVSRLSGVYYEWRTDEYPDRSFEDGRHIGFIAQDVEGVVPEAVTVGPDGTYSMRYQEIIPILVEAIKEQQQTIDEQRGVIARLDDRLTALEAAGTN